VACRSGPPCTIYDRSPPLQPIGDLYSTFVHYVILYVNRFLNLFSNFDSVSKIKVRSVETSRTGLQ